MTLLLDALDRTLTQPRCAQRWHRLMSIWAEAREPAEQQAALERVAAMPGGDTQADVLRATFLAAASGDSRHEHAAAALALGAKPPEPDRLAALMAFQWLSALQHGERRADFLATLGAGHMPEMARALMQSAAAERPANFLPRLPLAVVFQ